MSDHLTARSRTDLIGELSVNSRARGRLDVTRDGANDHGDTFGSKEGSLRSHHWLEVEALGNVKRNLAASSSVD